MLSDLERQLQIPPALRAAFKQLRNGVDYTQNSVEHGGCGDGSIPWATWTAARDAAVAFETLERALARLSDEVIPF
jgi:hypothetical protein